MKKKQLLKLCVALTEVIVAVINKEIADSQKETRRLHANSGIDAFEETQKAN